MTVKVSAAKLRKAIQAELTPEQRKEQRRMLEHVKTIQRAAKQVAEALGHQLGYFAPSSPSQYYTRCQQCWRGVSVTPALLETDGKGYGGKAVREACTGPAASMMKGVRIKAALAQLKGGDDE